MTTTFRPSLLGWAGALAALLFVAAAFGFAFSAYEGRRLAQSAAGNTGLIVAAQEVVSSLTAIESGERGFAITGAEEFLEPYRAGLAELADDLADLDAAAVAAAADPATIQGLKDRTAAEIDFVASVVEVRRVQGAEAAAEIVRQGEGKRLMDAVRAQAGAIVDAADGRIATIETRLEASKRFESLSFLATSLAALILAFIAYRRHRESKAGRVVVDGLVDSAPVGIAFFDERLNLVRQNRPFAAIALAGNGSLLLDPAFRALLDNVAQRGETLTDTEFATPGGKDGDSRRWLLLNAFPVGSPEAGGRPGVGLLVVDTTRRRRAEEKARSTESRFRSLVEATASIVWTAPASGRFEEAQPGWMRFTGQSEAEHLGNGWLEAVHPDDRDPTFRVWQAALDAKTPYRVEHRVRRADGDWRDMTVRGVPILDETGRLAEWIGTHTDVTDLRRTEARLGETGAQFAALADNIPQLAWMAEPSGEIFWYNKRWYDYTGTTLEEMRGFGWRAVHDPEHEARVVEHFQRQFAEGSVWEDTFPLRGVDGTYRWFLSQAIPIRDGDGRIIRWFGTNTDVTRQRAVEQELAAAKEAAENANRAKSQFIANMSHELRTPLTAVIGYAEMLEEEVEELGEAHLLSDLRKIEGNARHLLSLINNVLDLSKIEAERMDVYVESFEVGTVLDEVTSAIGSLLTKKDNRLVVEKAEGLGSARTDQVKLRQCLINLLSNASKFTENGTVTLRAGRETVDGRDWISFEVEDTGIGMSGEQVEKLFERFTQADASTTRKFGGTGLGLAITKAFCRLLGGDVGARSEEGKGSVFTIRIPADADVAAEDEAEIRQRPSDAAAGSAGLVLAIDDDPNARELLTRFLSREGFSVRTASDGLAGLDMARAIRPDVILLDVTMPRMDGWAVLTELKADPVLSGVPVVMVTIIDEHNLGYSLGASDYLLKPVEWSRLKDVMARYRTDGDALVLAIDDDADTLGRFATMMGREGIPVVTAPNGREGLDRVAEKIPTLILLDLVMPVMDGFEFLDALRARPEWRSIPVVVLTSKDLTADEWRRLQADADQILAKGDVALKDLAAEIRIIVKNGTIGDRPLVLSQTGTEPNP